MYYLKNKIVKKLLFIALFAFMMVSCTENQRAKTFGGTTEYQIPNGETFVNATWKDDDLWIITKDTVTNLIYMRECSSWGIFNGTVILKK